MTAFYHTVTPPLGAILFSLGAHDDWNGWSGGLRPVGVSGSFDVPFGHFAFDEAGVGAVAAGRVESPAQHHDGSGPAVVMVRRGKNRAPVRASVA